MATNMIVSAEPAPIAEVPGKGLLSGSDDDEAEAGHTGATQAVHKSTEAYLRFLVETEAKRENQDESDGNDKSFQHIFLTDILELGTTTSPEPFEPIPIGNVMARSSSQDRISQFSGMVRSTSLDRMSQLSVDSGDRTLKDTSLHGSAGGDPSGHGWAKGERSMERLIAETVSQVCPAHLCFPLFSIPHPPGARRVTFPPPPTTQVAKKRKLGLSNIWIPDSGRMVTAKVFQKLTTGSSEGLQFFGERTLAVPSSCA